MKTFVKVYQNFRKSCYATNCRSKFAIDSSFTIVDLCKVEIFFIFYSTVNK